MHCQKFKKHQIKSYELFLQNTIESILRKKHMEIDGKMCTYAEIKYIVVSSSGKVYRTLNLLLSEKCDTVYSVLDEKL